MVKSLKITYWAVTFDHYITECSDWVHWNPWVEAFQGCGLAFLVRPQVFSSHDFENCEFSQKMTFFQKKT